MTKSYHIRITYSIQNKTIQDVNVKKEKRRRKATPAIDKKRNT